ncbi:Ger(x)C family spore germination protein [Paenibacillus soyae]|uniref:Ger(X)C family spore germination protein n=1 Tax=Paenibacillus soyae TaxID=2969249 RepID=A0A9X2MMH0_9BACL|nr:Ger(x)C family spore germination protein [Paenibacillus soyae]MCR2804598.1 Ger(x)C family spore germination protein [Paenibacillus soyae]
MAYKTITLLLLVSVVLTGCWSKNELTERAFVMGVALDLREDGKIEMLTQVYRPSSAEIGKSTSTVVGASVNIKTVDDTVMEAIRDIPIHLGRMAQWSHMRVIIVGEELAKNMDMMQVLDLFYRDHEPRSSVSLMIAKGKAAKIFEKNPLIEQTTSQQILRTEESAYHNAAKTLDTRLLDLARSMKSAHPDTTIAYVYEDTKTTHMFSAAGLALIQDGKMKDTLPASKVEGYLMLVDKYKTGVVEIRCPGKKNVGETAELLALDSRMKHRMQGDNVAASVSIQGEISINELRCTKIGSKEEEEAFVGKVEAEVKRQAQQTLQILQKQKIDAIGLGNLIYRKKPKEWERLKADWNNTFAAIPFEVKVKLKLITGGTISSKTLSKQAGEGS